MGKVITIDSYEVLKKELLKSKLKYWGYGATFLLGFAGMLSQYGAIRQLKLIEDVWSKTKGEE